MTEPAKDQLPATVGLEPRLSVGIVDEPSPDSGPRSAAAPQLSVVVDGRIVSAKRAASCLVVPIVGDEVLVSEVGDRVYVLSILERHAAASSTVELGSGVRLEVEGRALRVEGAEEVVLAPEKHFTVNTKDVSVRAESLDAAVVRTKVFGQSFESTFDRLKTFARSIDVVADDVVSTLKRSLRFVSHLDQTRAKHIDTRAEGTLAMHAETTTITARTVAKIDSTQVHIG